jgi:hypothetical protein
MVLAEASVRDSAAAEIPDLALLSVADRAPPLETLQEQDDQDTIIIDVQQTEEKPGRKWTPQANSER